MRIALAFTLVLTATTAFSASPDTGAVGRLQDYIRIDTVNPPGNESLGVTYLSSLLDQAGIPYETIESAPGRGNLWATLKGGNAPALVLLHHIDVVPADARHWTAPPLGGELRDGYVWGRGAVDTKGLGIVQLQAFIALHQSGKPLNRDVILMATADEEAGGFFGAGWLVEHQRSLFDNVGFLVNEGGSGSLIGSKPVFRIEVTQKVPLWLRLTATDTPGHGSSPRLTSAVNRILRAGHRLSETRFEPRLVPEVKTLFEASAEFYEGEMARQLADISSAIKDEGFLTELQAKEPGSTALLRNTCSITRLEGSNKINVVPPTAAMEMDCRLLPDQDPEEFLGMLSIIINDPAITIEKIMGFTPAISPTATPLYESLTNVLGQHFPGVKVIPAVSTGFTDSHFFRDIGIVSYGFAPFLFPDGAETGIHGNNERIDTVNLERGTRIMTDFLLDFATD